MRTAEEAALYLSPMPDYLALTMLANRSHRLDCTLKTIKRVTRAGSFDNESLVILVTTNFAISHKVLHESLL